MADQPTELAIESATVTTDTKHTFGFDSFNKQTPMFAKNLFIVFYSMNTGVLAYISATHLLSAGSQYELFCLFKFIIDPLCYVVSRMWGVSPISATNEQ
jgi:hypothetical protein